MNHSIINRTKETILFLDKIEIDCTTNGWIVSATIQQDEYDWIIQRKVFQDDQRQEMDSWIQELLKMNKKDT